MRTLLDIVLDIAEISLVDSILTAKDAVLQKDSGSKCIKTKTGYSIVSGNCPYGRGKTEDSAWESAIINILNLYREDK